jgi:S-adenosylmethionine hydrolase
MPEVIIGIPMYDYRDCTAYVIEKLRENKFVVRYTHPNLLFISWKHWVPSYVRNEIKKKTGTVVDEFGNIVDTNLQETTTSESKIDSNELLFSTTKQIKNTQSATTNYKDTKTYKPSGHLVYNNNLLEKLKV